MGHNDHRIVMSLAVLATQTGGEIEGAEAVAKSYPDFFERIASLGIQTKEINP
jgi:3-phosphoshikimate 1-carboxyvinyltransferase